MIDAAYLKPSDLEKLKRAFPTGELTSELLGSIEGFLQNVEPDGGADTDRIQSVAHDLTVVGAWDYITAAQIAERLRFASPATTAVFVEALPNAFKKDVSYELIQSEAASDFVFVEETALDPDPVIKRSRSGEYVITWVRRDAGSGRIQAVVKKDKTLADYMSKKGRAAAIAGSLPR